MDDGTDPAAAAAAAAATAEQQMAQAAGDEAGGEAGDSTLSAAEKMRLRREARRTKILASSESRLGRITQTYAKAAPSEQASASVQAADSEPAAAAVAAAATSETPAVSEHHWDTQSPRQRQRPASGSAPSPARTQLPKGRGMDVVWAWIHAVSIALLAIIAVASFARVEVDDQAGDGVCGRLGVLATDKLVVFEDKGMSSGIRLGHEKLSIWILFASIEIGINSIRLVYNKYIDPLGAAPTSSNSILQFLGARSGFIASILKLVAEYHYIYEALMDDVLLFVFMVGASIVAALLASKAGIC
ncbi:hypothetical protein BC831DRAFT_552384 [Entophlyctis helioformis]|nr:hypothetical protein BC831DRAFT_552384 [Entophlyctis helioformis]